MVGMDRYDGKVWVVWWGEGRDGEEEGVWWGWTGMIIV